MEKKWFPLFSFLLISVTTCACARDYYTAAVLEHRRRGDTKVDSPQEVILKNLDIYARSVHVAKEKGADMIVFPEFGLFPHDTRTAMKPYHEYVPDPSQACYNPCNNPSEYNRTILHTLSCLAKNNSIYLVANMADIQPCTGTHCRDDGVYQYNTNVVFDRNGTLVTRYHKVHLCYEDGTDAPNHPQNPVFSTDFGTFAAYICFDILFGDIAETAQRVNHIAFPTMWFNAMPILNSVQLWQAFSITNNVTLLASNIHHPDLGNTGSGIFTPTQGAVKYTLNNDGKSKLIVSRIPLSGGNYSESSITVISENGTYDYPDEEDGRDIGPICDRTILEDNSTDLDYRCWRDNTENYTFAKLTEKSDVLQLCQNGMCCSLNYNTLEGVQDEFYLGVHNQTYSLNERYFWYLESCGVYRCEHVGNKTCATFPLESDTIFSHLELSANFSSKFVYPSVLQNQMRLAPFRQWNYSLQEAGNGAITSQLNYGNHNSPIVVAALVGRWYDRDPPFVP